MNGAFASRASRRAISVLPTPVGPIIKIFLGVILLRSASATWVRRQRLRRAIATARLASCWPMICLSSSWTISRGVMVVSAKAGRVAAVRAVVTLKLFDSQLVITVNADVGGDFQGLFGNRAGVEFGMLQ